MLAFTPEVEHAIEWFRWTHEPTDHGWQRRELPDAGRGGLARQDARLMAMLNDIRRHANQVLSERLEEQRRTRDLAAWRKKRLDELRG